MLLYLQEPNYKPQNNIFWREQHHWILQILAHGAAKEVRVLHLCHFCAWCWLCASTGKTAASSQKYIPPCFLFYHSQPRDKSCSKGHFVGSANCQPWLLHNFCLTGKSLSPSWRVFIFYLLIFLEKVPNHSD